MNHVCQLANSYLKSPLKCKTVQYEETCLILAGLLLSNLVGSTSTQAHITSGLLYISK